jgi:hypothetical protein
LSARGNAVTIMVKPRPNDAPSPWLPAQAMQLLDESSATPASINVGEPLTLTLRLVAQGLAAEQLPELSMPTIDGAEVYPDQESTQTRDDGEWLRGERVRKFAVVPTRPGALQIPEIGIDWWNVKSGRRERATLGGRVVQVAGVAAPTVSTPAIQPGSAAAPTIGSADADATVASDSWWKLGTFGFALLWLASMVLIIRSRRSVRNDTASPTEPAESRVSSVARVEWHDAVRSRDGSKLASALIALGRAHDSRCRNLTDVAALLGSDEQRAAILELQASLYGPMPSQDADEHAVGRVLAAFSRGPQWQTSETPAQRSQQTGLPELYESRR